MNRTEEVFRTQDLNLASFLKAKDYSLLDVEKSGRVATFVFENDEDMQRIITSFYNDNEMVKANKLLNSHRDLKSLVHNL
jgi:hypothetical protein